MISRKSFQKNLKCLCYFQATKKKSSKRLEEKIAEKEKKSREEAEARKILQEANMTPEERIAEKLRRQKLVEESDFEMAKETFGKLS